MPSLTDALWARYGAGRDPEARSRLLDSYLGLVYHSAAELARRLPTAVDLEDLIGSGTVGLVEALESFEPARGLAFSTYALPRIRGAMLDELRRRDWLPRSARGRARRVARARADLERRLGRAPAAAEVARELKVDLATYWRWAEHAESEIVLGLDPQAERGDAPGGHLSEALADPRLAPPDDEMVRAESLAELRDALAALPQKDRLVLSLYYYEELNLRQIGEVLHITESRVSQIRTRALRRLREWLGCVEEAA